MRDRNHTYLKSGLVINPDFSKLSASPWSLIQIQLTLMACWRSNGSERLSQSKHAASQKGFCCQLQDNGNLVLKQQHFQIQGQKSICHRKWCDLVLLPEFLYRRCFWEAMLVKFTTFYNTGLVPKVAEIL